MALILVGISLQKILWSAFEEKILYTSGWFPTPQNTVFHASSNLWKPKNSQSPSLPPDRWDHTSRICGEDRSSCSPEAFPNGRYLKRLQNCLCYRVRRLSRTHHKEGFASAASLPLWHFWPTSQGFSRARGRFHPARVFLWRSQCPRSSLPPEGTTFGHQQAGKGKSKKRFCFWLQPGTSHSTGWSDMK